MRILVILIVVLFLVSCSQLPLQQIGEGKMESYTGLTVELGDKIYSISNLRIDGQYFTKGNYYYFYGRYGNCGGYTEYLSTERPEGWTSK